MLGSRFRKTLIGTAVVALLVPSVALAHHFFNWLPPTAVPVGAGTSGLVSSDLNGDGNLDLAAVSTDGGPGGNGNVAVSYGNGAGVFGGFGNVRTGGEPVGVAVGDLDLDGRNDLAVINSATNDVTVLRNAGSGSFTVTATLAVGARPSDIEIGKVDRGNALDIVVASELGDSVTVWPGKNDGTFKPPIPTSVSNPVSLSVYDVDNDHKKDLAVASAADDLVRILLGDRTGNFVPGATYAASMPTSVFVSPKMNGDTHGDLAFTEYDANKVTYRLGVGNGTFGNPTSFTVNTPRQVYIGNVSNQAMDIIVTEESGSRVAVMLGFGGARSGTYDPPTYWPVGAGPVDIAIGKFDNVSMTDMAVASAVSGDVSVMLNATPNTDN